MFISNTEFSVFYEDIAPNFYILISIFCVYLNLLVMAILPLSILYKSNIEHNVLDIKLYVYVVLFEPYYQYIRLFTTKSLFIETLD